MWDMNAGPLEEQSLAMSHLLSPLDFPLRLLPPALVSEVTPVQDMRSVTHSPLHLSHLSPSLSSFLHLLRQHLTRYHAPQAGFKLVYTAKDDLEGLIFLSPLPEGWDSGPEAPHPLIAVPWALLS